MSDGSRPRRSGDARASGPAPARALLASLAALLGLAAAGQADARDYGRWTVDTGAQDGAVPAQAPAPQATATTPGPDGLREDGFYLEADTVGHDRERHIITARGHVQARYRGRTLRADEVIYEQETGLVTARGNAQIINPDGTVQYADEIALDEDLRAGIATGFAARLEQGYKVAAASAVRRSEMVNELNRAIFTPCDICKPDGTPKQPSFDIVADKVVQDRANRVVYYRSATVRLFGVPVFYAPVFWHPDPSAEAASGFLMPALEFDRARGASYTQPYLWVISPSADLTIAPQINSNVHPLLNGDYRQRFHSGQLAARWGYTYERDFDNEGDKFGDQESRGYVLADGRFAIDRDWRWGFAAEFASDDTFFDRYSVDGVRTRGLYLNDSRRLLSQVYTVRQTERSYLSVAALQFQSLRFETDPLFPSIRRPEDDDALPVVAPLVEARWEPNAPILGGRLRLFGSAVALERREQFLDPFAPRIDGVDSRRASGEADWRRAFTTAGGVRIEPFVTARFDSYSVTDLPGGLPDETYSRGNVTGGVDIRYPLFRRMGDTTVILEPMAQLAVSPRSDLNPLIPNEDSLVLEIDETNLFQPDRFPGYDLYEGGARMTVGGQATWKWGEGYREARVFLGRTFRADHEPAFPAESGFRDQASDWIVAGSVTPLDGVTAWTRARIDDSGKVRRGEAAVDWTTERTSGYVRYIVDEADAFNPLRDRREEVEGGGEALVTRNWGFTFRGHYDLREDSWRRSEIGLLYQDECLRLELVYERNDTRVGELKPSESVFLRLNLATLGNAGYRNDDRR